MEKDGSLYLSIDSDTEWNGKICFDWPRAEHAAAEINWARINEMPQWFVVKPEEEYRVRFPDSESDVMAGQKLIDGIELAVTPGQMQRIMITPMAEAEND
jgi:hypothetical protein